MSGPGVSSNLSVRSVAVRGASSLCCSASASSKNAVSTFVASLHDVSIHRNPVERMTMRRITRRMKGEKEKDTHFVGKFFSILSGYDSLAFQVNLVSDEHDGRVFGAVIDVLDEVIIPPRHIRK